MDQEKFREMALSLPEAVESSHMGHPDFRVGGRVFASLWPERNEGVAMLSPEQQEILCNACPDAFFPANGSWGLRGCTRVNLGLASHDDVATALGMAWRNKAPPPLAASLDEE